MPSHNHRVWSSSSWSVNSLGATHNNNVAGVGFVEGKNSTEAYFNTNSSNQVIVEQTGGGQTHSHSIQTTNSSTNTTGNNQPHNNMPPYIVIYIWKRIG